MSSLFYNSQYNDNNNNDLLYYLSFVIGWIYFSAWSWSFYGQVIENYRRKKVSGLNFDYEVYNLVGFSSYSIYTIWGYFDRKLGTGEIQIQDVFFAVHGLLWTCVHLTQIFIYYDKTDPNQRVNYFTIIILCVMIWGAILLLLVEYAFDYYDPHVTPTRNYVFNSLVYLGWCKVVISLIKYNPQAYYNFKRKSTIGWNIHNIWLDFTGGSFSFAQNIIDSIRNKRASTNDETSQSWNTAKFALSFISMFYDIIFMLQHYVFYRHSNTDLSNTIPANDGAEEETMEDNEDLERKRKLISDSNMVDNAWIPSE